MESARMVGQRSVSLIVVADPRYKREIYQDHENRARGGGGGPRRPRGAARGVWGGAGGGGERGGEARGLWLRWRWGLLPGGAVDGDVVGAVVEHEADALQVRHGLAGLAPDQDPADVHPAHRAAGGGELGGGYRLAILRGDQRRVERVPGDPVPGARRNPGGVGDGARVAVGGRQHQGLP